MLPFPKNINILKNKKSGFILLIIFAMLLVVACRQSGDQGQQRGGSSQPQPYPVIEIPRMTLTTWRAYPANIEGTNSSEVRAKVSGYITKVRVEEGKQVRKGQVRFELDKQSMSADSSARQT